MNDWRPTASIESLKLRAQLLARVRRYFEREGVLEVETPILSSAGTTDRHIHSFAARSLAPGDKSTERYLQTSPEFFMKRLLAAGSGSIYQICKVFRAGEVGRRHNPEFTMLEWYRVGYDYHRLMDDVDALIRNVLEGFRSLGPSERLTYREAFLRYADIDPLRATTAELINCAGRHRIPTSGLDEIDLDGWRHLLLTHLVEPHLGKDSRPTFIYDYPASQAALARVRKEDLPVAERFELYLDGIELANGFHELADAEEQRERFRSDRRARKEHALTDVPADEAFIAALTEGLPDCSGVALGFDRLVLLASDGSSLAGVLPFPAGNA